MFEKFISACVGILPKKLQEIYYKYEEAFIYTFFGGLTTLIGIVTKLAAFYIIPGKPAWESAFAVTFSWICAVTFAFFTNKKYVFKNVTSGKQEYFKVMISFYGSRATTWALEMIIFFIFRDKLGFSELVVTLASQVVIFILNYILSKIFVFRNKEEKNEKIQ